MNLLRVEPGLLIWLWIAFGIIVLILRLTVWDRIVGGLDARGARIQGDLASAHAAQEEAKRLLEEAKANLEEGKHQAAIVIEQARYQASVLREKLLADSRAELAAERARASREIAQEREETVARLRQEVVSLSLEVARAVLNRTVTGADGEALAAELLEKFPGRN
jgi:F-type H+-transporting ATPase subunit b